MTQSLASDIEISGLIATREEDGHDDLQEIDALLRRYPDDPRLHFMRGSVLAASSRPIEAHGALARAVEIAPDFRIARYQLGFFELTSGEAGRALSTWGPLLAAPDSDYLRIFVEGMTHLIRDEFSLAIEKFQKGLVLNDENQPLNNDIRLLMAEVERLSDGRAEQPGDTARDLSATSLILGQFGGNRVLH